MSTGPADQNLVKRINSALILDCLLTNSPQSRANLAQHTGLNRSTISSLVTDLIERNLIREVGLETVHSPGRPGMLLELNPAGGCILGMEINVGYVAIILTDFTAHTLWQRHVEIDVDSSQEEVLALSESLICEALRIGAIYDLKPLGIGLGLPGLVDAATGTLVYAPNLKWRNVCFRDLWGSKFGIPLYVENDGGAAALGEYYFGVAKGCANFIYLGTGVGLAGGLMLNGQLYRGASGYAGEVGHITIEPGGAICGCGRRGCWETLVGPTAVINGIVEALGNGTPSLIPELVGGQLENITMQGVVTAADLGDQLALEALAQVAQYLGVGIANLVNLFNPKLIVLGGLLTPAGEYLLPTISQTITSEALTEPARIVALALSSRERFTCVKGAVALVIDGIVRTPAPC